jgi:hypothetical protein
MILSAQHRPEVSMGEAKRETEAYQERLEDIGVLAEEIEFIDAEGPADEAVGKSLFAAAFAAWRDGKLSGTAEEVYEAVRDYLDPITGSDVPGNDAYLEADDV